MNKLSQVNMNRRDSDQYMGSVYTNDPEQMELLKELRREQRVLNKTLDRKDKKRIMLMGREPKVGRYANNGGHGWTPLGNAKRIDLYKVHTYSQWVL